MNRKPQFLLVLVVGFGLLSGAMCPMDPPASGDPNTSGNNSGDGSDTGDNGSDNGDTGSSEAYRLNINWEGEGFGTSFFGAQIWAIVGDGPMGRADADYGGGSGVAQRFIRSSNSPDRLFRMDVEAGKTVSVIAFDDAGKTINLFLGAVPPAPEETTQIEFVSMSGDIDSMPETGVGTVLMDEDKDVTVTFAPMPTVVISNSGLGLYNVQLEVFGWLNHPDLNGISPTADCMGDQCNTQCLGGQVWDGPVLHLAYKTGTRLTITSIDCIADQYDWLGWDAGDNCTDRTCILTFGLDGSSNANWKEK